MAVSRRKAVNRGEQRSGNRFTLLLRAAKLITASGEFLCLIRDVSDRGMKVRLFHPLAIDAPCEIELGNGGRIALDCVWQKGDQAGFRFTHGPIAVQGLIDENGPFPKRHLRLRLDPPLPLFARVDGAVEAGQLRDISQHGAAISLNRRLPMGAQVRIEAHQLPRRDARVCWRRGTLHGLVFQQGFRLDELAHLGWELQLGAAEPANSSLALTND